MPTSEHFTQRGAQTLPGHLGTALDGQIECLAMAAHAGRTTQMVLYPRAGT